MLLGIFFWPTYYLFQMSVTILTDSIGKYVRDIKHANIYPFPGITIERLTHKLQHNHTFITDTPFLLIHVGTNNLCTHSAAEIRQLFKNLVSTVQSISPACTVLISAILHRCCDHSATRDKIVEINFDLDKFRIAHTIFIRSYVPFMKFGLPQQHLYACDGLHLKPSGVLLLKQLWANKLVLIRRGQFV